MTNTSVLITHVVNDAVISGFIPTLLNEQQIDNSKQVEDIYASLIIITDHKNEHIEALANHSINSHEEDDISPNQFNIQLFECDVFNPLAIIDILNNHNIKPKIVFSNSDHLQASTAIVADFYELPCKKWKQCIIFKDKHLTRAKSGTTKLYRPNYQLLNNDDLDHKGSLNVRATDIDFPLVIKPKHGVASQNVKLCSYSQDLIEFARSFWDRNPTTSLLLEEYVEGKLITLETLGDGERLVAIGGFEVTLSPPPYFVELGAVWNTDLCQEYCESCLQILSEMGVGLGVCHSEFIITPNGKIHLVEINYRSIGDGREFLLNKMAHYPWFEVIIHLHQGITIDELEQKYGTLNINTHAMIRYITTSKSGIIKKIPDAFEKHISEGSIIHQPLKELEQFIHLTHSNKDYLSRLSVFSKNFNHIQSLMDDALNAMEWHVS